MDRTGQPTRGGTGYRKGGRENDTRHASSSQERKTNSTPSTLKEPLEVGLLSGLRTWLFDHQTQSVRIAGSLCFVTAAGSVVATVVRQDLLSAILLESCTIISVAFFVARAYLVRSWGLGWLSVGLGALAVVIQAFGLLIVSTVVWLPLIAVATILNRRPAVSAVHCVVKEEEQEPANPQNVSPDAAAAHTTVAEPGFRYLPPPGT